MKMIYRAFVKGTNWALAGLMGVLGFSGCSNDSPAEYGTPIANYKVSGRVTNESGKPIAGIQVELEETDISYSSYAARAFTNTSGEYEITTETIGRAEQLRLIVSDIDKSQNGLYQNDTIQVKIEKEDYYDKGKGWNVGKAYKEINPRLKEKTNIDE